MVFKTIGVTSLDSKIDVRLTKDEKEKIAEDADLAGMSMSALIRSRYFGRPVIANTDRVMIKELRRLGGLLKHVHNESNGVYSKETSDVLSQVSKYIVMLSKK